MQPVTTPLLTSSSTRPWINVHLESSRYRVKTCSSHSEILQALRLRHEVFFVENLGRAHPLALDVDEFDSDSDHLIVIENSTGLVVGNYRIRCSLFHSRFYTETEFYLHDFLQPASGVKIELGRACVHKAHRRGVVIQLLWRGLLKYMASAGARHLFGCSSVPLREPGQVEAVWKHLQDRSLISIPFKALPRNPFHFRPPVPETSARLPVLLDSYLKSGARVIGPPSYDSEFDCADFLTVLDVAHLSESRARRYDECFLGV